MCTDIVCNIIPVCLHVIYIYVVTDHVLEIPGIFYQTSGFLHAWGDTLLHRQKIQHFTSPALQRHGELAHFSQEQEIEQLGSSFFHEVDGIRWPWFTS